MFIYKGSCHCRRVQFEVRKLEPIDTLIECNCSICTQKGDSCTRRSRTTRWSYSRAKMNRRFTNSAPR